MFYSRRSRTPVGCVTSHLPYVGFYMYCVLVSSACCETVCALVGCLADPYTYRSQHWEPGHSYRAPYVAPMRRFARQSHAYRRWKVTIQPDPKFTLTNTQFRSHNFDHHSAKFHYIKEEIQKHLLTISSYDVTVHSVCKVHNLRHTCLLRTLTNVNC